MHLLIESVNKELLPLPFLGYHSMNLFNVSTLFCNSAIWSIWLPTFPQRLLIENPEINYILIIIRFKVAEHINKYILKSKMLRQSIINWIR